MSSLGGVELLFPLLEQVDIPLKVHGGEGGGRRSDGIDELLTGGSLASIFNG